MQYRSDASRTGLSSEVGPTNLEVLVWERPLTGPVIGLVYDRGVVYAGAFEALYAVNAASGTDLWAFARPGVQFSPVAVVGDVVYVNGGNVLYALDRTNGALLWSVDAGADISRSAPLVVGDTVYVGAADGTVLAVDAGTGAEQWRRDVGSAVTAPLVLGANNLLIAVTDDALLAIAANNGAERWSVAGDWSPAASDGKHVYAGNSANDFYSLDVRTGSVEWTFNDPDTVNGGWSAPTIANGVVVAGNANNNLNFFDAATGTRYMQQQTSYRPQDATATAPGWLYLGEGSVDGPELSLSLVSIYSLTTGMQAGRYVYGQVTSGVAVGEGMVFVYSNGLGGVLSGIRGE